MDYLLHKGVFSVNLVSKEELNLLLVIPRKLVKVWRVELGSTDSLSQILRIANLWIDKDPNYLMILALGKFNLRRNKKSLG